MATPQRPNPLQQLIEWLRTDTRWHVPALIGIPTLVVVLIVGVVVLGGGGNGDEEPPVNVKSARPTSPAEDDPLAFLADGVPGAPGEDAPPLVTSIEELHEVFGEPPFADIGRMRIPALGVNAPISLRIVGEDGAMPNPVGPDEVTLYDFSPFGALGGTPGSGGNAILSGHVDQRDWLEYAGVNYEGLAIFAYLTTLTPGQTIEVEVYGAVHSYVVQWVREVGASSNEWTQILGPDPSGADAITLITCGGDFNAVEGSYASRTVVRAVAG